MEETRRFNSWIWWWWWWWWWQQFVLILFSVHNFGSLLVTSQEPRQHGQISANTDLFDTLEVQDIFSSLQRPERVRVPPNAYRGLFSLLKVKNVWSFGFLWPCIVSKVWRQKNQQDATIRCLLLTSVSTCFGHHYAHLQENKEPITAFGVLFWFCWMWLVAVVGQTANSPPSCKSEKWLHASFRKSFPYSSVSQPFFHSGMC